MFSAKLRISPRDHHRQNHLHSQKVRLAPMKARPALPAVRGARSNARWRITTPLFASTQVPSWCSSSRASVRATPTSTSIRVAVVSGKSASAGSVNRGRCGRGAVLRVERREKDALATLREQRLQLVRDRRTPVAHRVSNRDAFAHPLLQSCRLRRRNRGERRAGVRPDLRIGMRGFPGPCP